LEDLGADGDIVSEWILKEISWEGIDWIDLAEDRDRWWALVNMVMNICII
jgi:hypothetical protein